MDVSTPFGPFSFPVSVHDVDLDDFPTCTDCEGTGIAWDGSRCWGCGGVGVRMTQEDKTPRLHHCGACLHSEETDHPMLVGCSAGQESLSSCGMFWKTDSHVCGSFLDSSEPLPERDESR